jgi:hypothetical protein
MNKIQAISVEARTHDPEKCCDLRKFTHFLGVVVRNSLSLGMKSKEIVKLVKSK